MGNPDHRSQSHFPPETIQSHGRCGDGWPIGPIRTERGHESTSHRFSLYSHGSALATSRKCHSRWTRPAPVAPVGPSRLAGGEAGREGPGREWVDSYLFFDFRYRRARRRGRTQHRPGPRHATVTNHSFVFGCLVSFLVSGRLSRRAVPLRGAPPGAAGAGLLLSSHPGSEPRGADPSGAPRSRAEGEDATGAGGPSRSGQGAGPRRVWARGGWIFQGAARGRSEAGEGRVGPPGNCEGRSQGRGAVPVRVDL